MAANSFADTVVNGMLSWLKGFASWVLRLFDLAGSGGVSPLEWLSEHWLQLLIVLLIVGVAADIIVWLIRWRPYWVWFRKKRIVVDDEDFFADEETREEEAQSDTIPLRPVRRPDTIVRREPASTAPSRSRPARAPKPKADAQQKREPPRPDVFEDELFRIQPSSKARKVPEDAVFNVSDLPRAQAQKKRPPAKKPAARKEDDLFDLH